MDLAEASESFEEQRERASPAHVSGTLSGVQPPMLTILFRLHPQQTQTREMLLLLFLRGGR